MFICSTEANIEKPAANSLLCKLYNTMPRPGVVTLQASDSVLVQFSSGSKQCHNIDFPIEDIRRIFVLNFKFLVAPKGLLYKFVTATRNYDKQLALLTQ